MPTTRLRPWNDYRQGPTRMFTIKEANVGQDVYIRINGTQHRVCRVFNVPGVGQADELAKFIVHRFKR